MVPGTFKSIFSNFTAEPQRLQKFLVQTDKKGFMLLMSVRQGLRRPGQPVLPHGVHARQGGEEDMRILRPEILPQGGALGSRQGASQG